MKRLLPILTLVLLASCTSHRHDDKMIFRYKEIDSLTIPGFEADAAEAKANGTSAVDFVKSIAAKAKQKGTDFLAARAQETAPAQEVTAGAAEDDDPSEEEQIQAEAKKIAEYAAEMSGTGNGMF